MQVSNADVLNYVSDVHVYFVRIQAKHDLQGKSDLLTLIRKYPEGLPVIDVKDAYPSVMDDLQVAFCMLSS